MPWIAHNDSAKCRAGESLLELCAVPRPSKFDKKLCEQAQKLCRLGATDAELAEFFDISESTLNKWKIDYPAFSESIKSGKTIADAEVAQKLYHRAIGYEHPDTHVSNYQGKVTLTPLIKHYAPDPTAAIFWLKNRQPGKWRDIKAVELSGKDGEAIALRFSKVDERVL